MIVLDDAHLAWWERSKRAVLEDLSHDKRVCVMYANFKAQRDGVLESGFLRFFGSVELHERGSVREAILRSCCRASRRMSARRPASASSSRSTRRSIFAANRLWTIRLSLFIVGLGLEQMPFGWSASKLGLVGGA